MEINKGNIILIGGYCATGKSTFAKMLSERTGISYFNKDTIKEVVAEEIGQENDGAIRRLSPAAFALMYFMADRMLMRGKALILESNFKPREIEKLNELIKSHGSACLSFVFKGDLDVLYNRYKSRDASGERHWVHRTTGEIKDNFKAGQIPLGEISPPGDIIYVDASDFGQIDYDGMIKSAIDFLDRA